MTARREVIASPPRHERRECQVVFFVDAADEEYEPLLGYVALGQSQAAVDMARHQLIKIRHLDLK